MKLLIFATLVSLATADVKHNVREDLAKQWDEVYEPHKQECIQESGVNAEDVRDMFKRGHFPDKYEFKCYIKCVALKLKCLTEDGVINLENLPKYITGADLDIREDSLRSVENIKDLCEKSYIFVTTAVAKLVERYPPQTEIK